VDVDGHRDDAQCASTLARLGGELPLFKILGSYPRDLAGGTA
jgi:prephenate dehydratase